MICCKRGVECGGKLERVASARFGLTTQKLVPLDVCESCPLEVLVLNVPEQGCAKASTSQRRVAPKPIRRVLQQPEHDEELVVKHLEPMQSYRPAQRSRQD
jgi:hypothetical protein